jgi:hypothetical protein
MLGRILLRHFQNEANPLLKYEADSTSKPFGLRTEDDLGSRNHLESLLKTTSINEGGLRWLSVRSMGKQIWFILTTSLKEEIRPQDICTENAFEKLNRKDIAPEF